MSPIKVMVNGIPGNMATTVARHIIKDKRFEILTHSLTGPEIPETERTIETTRFSLIRPEIRDQAITEIKNRKGLFISIDYSLPSAVSDNADFYCRHGLPFVMGTTGGNREGLADRVSKSTICAVIAPNMAKQIVGFQAMMDFAASNFPDLFSGYSLEIKESHQQGKADTSGTARAMVTYFNKMGVPFTEQEIIKVRDPEVQQVQWGVPQGYLRGHGWHTYTLVSADQTVRFAFTHNVNGRDVYAKGTLDAIVYLHKKLEENTAGTIFTMMDVLKGV